ncbi:L,D-transpeptidase family protein [Gluconobacter wancherniae]|uniref:L,D-transpeptidase family protein n=1 Tax=Gluconobacter wancherniae TaxID=1307955 RepID=UPI001B8B82A7|nr:L,D-transpeptidase family protein [Gluconobacter wancherniae]MBS1088218.1 L,D-transpeptidase family protein [Gluconobacter wancherniae]
MCKAVLRSVGQQRVLLFENRSFRAFIGESGVSSHKTEGDHATPVGTLPFRRILYRADRVARPVSSAGLPVEPIAPNDGWCDDPSHPEYNRAVTLPHPASCERMWRDDDAYDLCVVLGWNDMPPVPSAGSAIFLHLPPRRGVTEGCIAVDESDLRYLLENGVTEIVVEHP